MSTALELTSAEKQSYIESIRQRMALLDKPLSSEEASVREHLLTQARLAALEIKARCGARRVILFGSLAHGAWFWPDSDVDLAVEGLKGDAYWQAWRLAEQAIPDRRVDLIDVDTASPSLRHAIEHHGIAL